MTQPQPSTGRGLSRRQLLGRAAAGAVLITPLNWLAPRQTGAGTLGDARPEPPDAFDAGVATAWFDELLSLIRQTPGYSPPVASRAIAYSCVALYEAVVAGMPDHVSLAGLVNALAPLPGAGRNGAYHWPSAANAALAEMARQLFPTAPASSLAAVDALESSYLTTAPRGIRERSVDHGRAVARAVFAWSMADGGHEGYLRNFPADYAPPAGPGLWVPTPPGYLRALQPYWGDNRTFLPGEPVGDPGPPVPYSTDPASHCFAEAHEVFITVNELTDEQFAIARFWSDDPGITPTPPGHSVSILNQILRQQDASLAQAAEAYARLGIALADAFIACWRIKYRYNLLRPITYIRDVIDPTWGKALPVTTPPFPEYTSGHSVQSAAAAAVLTAQFGDVAFVDHSHDARGLPARSFASFDAAAAEAAISRLYGGIHFRAAIDRGLVQGRLIGGRAAALPLHR
jgi:hypothetical protein